MIDLIKDHKHIWLSFGVPMQSPGPVSVLISVNFGLTNQEFIMWSSDTFGEWLLLILVSGHSDLPDGFYGAK